MNYGVNTMNKNETLIINRDNPIFDNIQIPTMKMEISLINSAEIHLHSNRERRFFHL